MPTEAEKLRAEIEQYDALISNRNRQTQRVATAVSHYHPYKHPSNHYNHQPQVNARWATRGGYYARGRGRGGGPPQIHRNRSLVLNNVANLQTAAQTGGTPAPNQAPAAGESATPAAWVSRSDRHLQLINPAIFEKESQTRAKAIEETRKLKLKQKDERERIRFAKHVQRYGSVASSNAQITYEIIIQDVKFCVTKNGSKLLKLPDPVNAAKATPKTAVVGGVLFHRSKSGNMYRATVVKAQGSRPIKKINEPCKIFSTTGSCTRGPTCRYVHEATKVAVCKDYLMKGECLAGESCDLSHDLTPERTPACLHFSKGHCSNANCRYTHVHVAANAPVCKAFAIYGYCEKGSGCSERHVYECPDFSNTGTCKTKDCKLPHKHKASVIRRNTATVDDDVTSDLSSDEDDEEIDSDDVDSDDMTEFFGGGDAGPDESIIRQDSFIHY